MQIGKRPRIGDLLLATGGYWKIRSFHKPLESGKKSGRTKTGAHRLPWFMRKQNMAPSQNPCARSNAQLGGIGYFGCPIALWVFGIMMWISHLLHMPRDTVRKQYLVFEHSCCELSFYPTVWLSPKGITETVVGFLNAMQSECEICTTVLLKPEGIDVAVVVF